MVRGFLFLLTLILVGAKVVAELDISWFMVMFPAIIALIMTMIIPILGVLTVGAAYLRMRKH